MPTAPPPPRFDPMAHTPSGVDSNKRLIGEQGQSFRRIKSNEAFDEQGIRTVWHRGAGNAELLTWENHAGEILKQEFTFCGMLTEYVAPYRIRTGQVPHVQPDTACTHPQTALVTMDTKVSSTTLDYASHLLRNIPAKDFYVQHLLKQINATIAEIDADKNLTNVNLESFSKRPAWEKDRASSEGVRPRGTTRKIAIALAIAVSAIGGAAAIGALCK